MASDIHQEDQHLSNEDGRGDAWEIHYEIDPCLDFKRRHIENAMDEIEKYSRIQFLPRTTQRCYLNITKDDGCYFNSGDNCFQSISLGVGCRDFGTILHELLHVFGFEHEHNRPDRDEYLTIHWDNIEEEHKIQFEKLEPSKYKWNDFQIDYESIMMYDSYSFSKNDLITIERKNGGELVRNNKLSEMDKEKLRLL
ncbi:Astacin-like metalloprotease toxin 5 [Argiope bruennichi]|uniref:Metalloendopeptidase n=1 Tax=Argiope bruennichi TaxID=94029 RepID=A0A8T0E136_ARGBR|nr:Astacin-like metalloprotease toxin 5 [Argiope bruennichi]